MIIPQTILEQFAAASRKAAGHGLMRCSSGNISLRLDDQHMLIKASRAWMSDLNAADISVCRIADEACLSERKPSVELGFHSGILRHRADVNVVLHFQTPCATTLACSQPTPNFFVIPEIPYYIGPIGLVPYIPPGSVPLAEAVTQVMKTHNLSILANHGMVTVGKTFDDAIQKAVFFELACEIILRAGAKLNPLSADAVSALLKGGSGA